jgi:hypothetical protein
MAGDPAIRAAVHEATRGELRASIMVGATHWDRASLEPGGLSGPEPVLFFAPTAAEERAAELGPVALGRSLGAAWTAFATTRLKELVRFEHATGVGALGAAWAALVEGDADPRVGLVLSL